MTLYVKSYIVIPVYHEQYHTNKLNDMDEFQQKALADILSVLAMTNSEPKYRECLTYKLFYNLQSNRLTARSYNLFL